MNKIDIITGDALIEMRKIESSSVDLIIADPPYNLGKDYGNNGDMKDVDEYLEFSRRWIRDCCRILKPSGQYMFSWDSALSPIFTTY